MKEIIKKHTKSFIVITFIILGFSLWSTLHPYIVKEILDLDFTKENILQQIIILILLYASVHILRAIFANLRNIKVNKTVVNILQEVRQKLFEKVLSLPMKEFEKYNSSEIYTRLTADVNNMNTLFADSIPIVAKSLLYLLFMMIMMFIADIKLGSIGILTLIIVGLNSFYFVCKTKKIEKIVLDKRDMENKKYLEIYRKNKLTYLFGLQKNNTKEMKNLLQEELKYRKRLIIAESIGMPLSRVIEAIGIFVILYVSLTINKQIPLGNIYLVIYYLKQCKRPLDDIFNQLEEMQTCINSYERIKKILNIQELEDIKKGTDVKTLEGNIEFDRVCMNYGDKQVLDNISFTISKGQKVTIVGRQH